MLLALLDDYICVDFKTYLVIYDSAQICVLVYCFYWFSMNYNHSPAHSMVKSMNISLVLVTFCQWMCAQGQKAFC